MKKLIFLLIPFLLCGCSHDMNRKELDEIDLVQVVGIDFSDEWYTISALYNTGGASASEDKGGASGQDVVAKGIGKSLYEAYENLKLKNKKSISIAHTGCFLIGERAAIHGIDGFMDFLSRDETVKMESFIYILKNTYASDFLEQGIENKKKINSDLEAINQKQKNMLTRNDNTLVNVLNDMKHSYSSILIPYLISQEDSFLIEGYAVFDNLKLKDYLDHETSVGVDFTKDIVRSYPIYLKDRVGLALTYSKTKLKTKLEHNLIKVIIKIDFESMIKEVLTDDNIFTQEELDTLTEEQNRYIKELIAKPVKYSIDNGLDIMQIARLYENQHVKEWKNYESTWTQNISNIKYSYVINSKITTSFIMGNERESK